MLTASPAPGALRVLHMSTHDQTGGAARSAYRLHRGLRSSGIDSRMLVVFRRSNDPSVAAASLPSGGFSRIARAIRRRLTQRELLAYRRSRPPGLEQFSDDRNPYGPSVLGQVPEAAVINLHWVAEFIDYTSFFRCLPTTRPVVWRLSDMNPFTGGCHYSGSCRRWVEGCGACPQLGSTDPKDLSWRVWTRKQRAFASLSTDQLSIVAQSRWMAGEVSRSPLLARFPTAVIANGVDTEEFRPVPRSVARDALCIPREARVVAFVAQSLACQRKGLQHLLDALEYLGPSAGITLVTVGGSGDAVNSPMPHVALGSAESGEFLRLAYSAADVFAIPTVQENLPNTVLEALACGTPVVGFAVGGVKDLVSDGENGLLVPTGDSQALAGAIRRILEDPSLHERLRTQARRAAVDHFTLESQVRAYITHYEDSVARASRNRQGPEHGS